MKLLGFSKNEHGWTLELDTEKKPFPRQKGQQSIKQSELFPMIPVVKDGFPPKVGDFKVYGSIIVKGTMKYFPLTKTMRKGNSLYWGRYVGEESSIVQTEVEGFIPRQKEPMDIGFDREYVFDGKEWTPFLVWQYLNEQKADIALDKQGLFHKVMETAGKDQESIQTVLDAFLAPVVKMQVPKALKKSQVVPVDVAEKASTFHYSGEAHRDFNPFNGPSPMYRRKLSEVIIEPKYMNAVQMALAKKLQLV